MQFFLWVFDIGHMIFSFRQDNSLGEWKHLLWRQNWCNFQNATTASLKQGTYWVHCYKRIRSEWSVKMKLQNHHRNINLLFSTLHVIQQNMWFRQVLRVKSIDIIFKSNRSWHEPHNTYFKKYMLCLLWESAYDMEVCLIGDYLFCSSPFLILII